MKKLLKISALTLLTLFAVTAYSPVVPSDAAQFDVYSLISEKHLEFYERELAKHPVYSNIDKRELAETADNYGISVDKLQKVLVFQDAMKAMGTTYAVRDILALSPGDLISKAKAYIDWLKSNKSPEEMQEISRKFKALNQEG